MYSAFLHTHAPQIGQKNEKIFLAHENFQKKEHFFQKSDNFFFADF